MKILEGPEELPDGEARLSASDWLREWQGGVATVPESARLCDEEAARTSSAGPFVLPPACGATEGAEVGQKLAVLESQDPERSRRRRSARCEKDDKWAKRVDPSSGADASSARARGGDCPAEPRSRDSNATGSEIIV